MAIKNVAGHGTTTVLGPHGGQGAVKGAPTFMHTQGPAAYQGPVKRAGGGLPGGSRGGKKSSRPQAPNKSVSPIVR